MAKTVNAAKFIGGTALGWKPQTAMAPTESGMPDRRPVDWDRGAIMKPECPAAWQLTAAQLVAVEAEIRVIQATISSQPTLAGALSDQLKAAEQKVARHQAFIRESKEADITVASHQAAKAIKAAMLRGVDVAGALSDFLSAISVAGADVALMETRR